MRSEAITNRPPVKPKNEDVRPREWLTHQEVDRLIKAASKRRNGLRDSFLIRFAYAHALRVGELVNVRWSQIDFENARVFLRREKGGAEAVHYIEGEELRLLRRLRRENESPFVFCSERGTPFSERGVYKIVSESAKSAGFAFNVHPHMLRHAKGYNLANRSKTLIEIQDYLGHKDPKSTRVYTKLNAERFAGFGGHHD